MITFIAAAALQAVAPPPATPAEFRRRIAKNLSFSVVVEQPGVRRVLLIGLIDATMATRFRQTLAAWPDIDAVMVDSYGGDIDSAMDIATLIRRRKMQLVVDGRCLSACANYLFPAAVAKTVLPESVVAIHGLTVQYQEGAALKTANASDAGELFRTSAHAADREAYQRSLARQNAFYREVGLKPDAHLAFARYLANRKLLFGTDLIQSKQQSPDCPPAQMWVLDKRQWQSLGVQGIAAYWYPTTAAQRSQLLRDLGMPAGYFYYGPTERLTQLCAPTINVRLRRWLTSLASPLFEHQR